MTKGEQHKNELADVLSRIKTPRLMRAFLEDLFSPREFIDVAQRLQIVKQLDRGVSQRQIARDLGVGIGTVTRGAAELRDEEGGFREVLNLLR
ncbi:MAG: Trp family transcriptional regulator [Patescibacteria group bacterium]